MAEVHRKIELQEQEDLRFLIANVLRVATSQIDTNLPPVEGEDTLRPQVQELVHEVSSCFFDYHFLTSIHPPHSYTSYHTRLKS